MRGAHHRRCAREGLTVRHYALLWEIWQVSVTWGMAIAECWLAIDNQMSGSWNGQ